MEGWRSPDCLWKGIWGKADHCSALVIPRYLPGFEGHNCPLITIDQENIYNVISWNYVFLTLNNFFSQNAEQSQNYQIFFTESKKENNVTPCKCSHMNNNGSNSAKGIFLSKQDNSFPFSSNTMMDNAFQEETVINQLYFSVRQ